MTPRYKPSVPSVATIAGIFSQATSTPLINPASSPSSSVATQATGKGYPAFNSSPNSTAHIPVIDPTDTSMLRVSITSVEPIASSMRIWELLKIIVSV